MKNPEKIGFAIEWVKILGNINEDLESRIYKEILHITGKKGTGKSGRNKDRNLR